MSVAQSTVVTNWFKGKELNFALGVNISLSRLGSVFNANTIPALLQNYSLGTAFFFGFGVCCFSLLNATGVCIMDKYAEVKDGKKKDTEETKKDEKIKLSDLKQLRLPFWLLCISCVVTYMTIFPYI